jgi:hypothetical protein
MKITIFWILYLLKRLKDYKNCPVCYPEAAFKHPGWNCFCDRHLLELYISAENSCQPINEVELTLDGLEFLIYFNRRALEKISKELRRRNQ